MNWKIGKIKFYSEEKGFGYMFDGSGHWSDKEYYFDNQSLFTHTFKSEDNVCFKATNVDDKIKVTEIALIDSSFLNKYFNELDYNFKTQLMELMPKEFNNRIKKLVEENEPKLNSLKKDSFYDSEELNIDDYIDDFKITLVINKHNNVGDDASINIFYSISNPKLDHITVENFKSSILSHKGFIDIYDIEKDFIENQKEEYEKKIPKLLADLKLNLRKNYIVNKTKVYRYTFKHLFQNEIKNSICKVGFEKTIEDLEIVLDNYSLNIKDEKFYSYRYSLKKIN